MTVRSLACGLAAASFALAAPVRGQEPRLITERDLLEFIWIADPQIAPDGSQVVFTRVVITEARDDYDTALWIVSATGNVPARPLTTGPRDSSPRWSPDGRTLAFVRAVE
jgi:dipeptidyl aminopeptidase/acylaminoacyl peptidase